MNKLIIDKKVKQDQEELKKGFFHILSGRTPEFFKPIRNITRKGNRRTVRKSLNRIICVLKLRVVNVNKCKSCGNECKTTTLFNEEICSICLRTMFVYR